MTTQMTRSERGQHDALPPGSRPGVVAGGGSLPAAVARRLAEAGHSPFVLIVEGEVTRFLAELSAYDHEIMPLENIGNLVPILKRHGVTHLVLAGEIRRRPRLSAVRPSIGLLKILPELVKGLVLGDDGILRIIVRGLEARGIAVVGPHQIVPDILAPDQVLTRARPQKSDWADIEQGFIAAKTIGRLDVGQAAVAIGGRVIALEGIEGTAGLLDRVASLRSHGRLAGKARGVLVKCAKPQQELRVDLPTIGPETVDSAHRAGLAGIVVEAEKSFILDSGLVMEKADTLGLFVMGLKREEP